MLNILLRNNLKIFDWKIGLDLVEVGYSVVNRLED